MFEVFLEDNPLSLFSLFAISLTGKDTATVSATLGSKPGYRNEKEKTPHPSRQPISVPESPSFDRAINHSF